MWEEDFEVEPLGDDDYTQFRKLHTPGFEGWTYARYRHHDGSPQSGDPARIIEDLDADGIWAQLLHPNHASFGLYTHDHHELSMAHARVYSDYVTDAFAPYRDRVFTTSPIPLSDIDDAVAEIERVAALGVAGDHPAGDVAGPVHLARARPGVGRGTGQRHARGLPRGDRWREGGAGDRRRRSRA